MKLRHRERAQVRRLTISLYVNAHIIPHCAAMSKISAKSTASARVIEPHTVLSVPPSRPATISAIPGAATPHGSATRSVVPSVSSESASNHPFAPTATPTDGQTPDSLTAASTTRPATSGKAGALKASPTQSSIPRIHAGVANRGRQVSRPVPPNGSTSSLAEASDQHSNKRDASSSPPGQRNVKRIPNVISGPTGRLATDGPTTDEHGFPYAAVSETRAIRVERYIGERMVCVYCRLAEESLT